MKTTKTIAGRKITLTRGQRYMAGRPFASRGRKAYPVTIYQITHGFSFQNGVATIDVRCDLAGMLRLRREIAAFLARRRERRQAASAAA